MLLVPALRPDGDGRPVACVANLTPVPRHGYRLGLPSAGRWVEVLNTDAAEFGGSGVGNGEVVDRRASPWHGHAQSVAAHPAALGVVWLAPEPDRPHR